MRIKRDAIPGMRVQIWFTPIRTGKFDIVCSQLCGLGHYRMKGELTVENPEQFKQWVKSHTTLYSANP
jgi:cytochrome c oxidase subunit 2